VEKKVIVVGAGIAGLSAGIVLQQKGIGTEIFEMAPRAGGLCAGWVRKGYRFDCLSWLTGISKNDPIYKLFYSLGALQDGADFYRPENVFFEIDGRLYEIPMELCRFREFFRRLSPRDARTTDEICDDIEAMMRTWDGTGLPQVSKGMLKSVKQWKNYRTIYKKYTIRTVRELSALYENPIAGKILTRIIPGEYSALQMFASLSTRMAANAGYPMGGAAGIVKGMVSKYLALGGKINCGIKVDEIIVNGEAASGIRAQGEFFKADGVIAACDTHEILDNLLKRRYEHPSLRAQLKNAALYEPLAVISFGLVKKLGIPYALTCECRDGIDAAPGVRRYGFALRSFDFDPSAAPTGGSSVMAMFEAPLGYWRTLRQEDPDSYRLRKEQLADQIASEIEKRYPGFKDAVCIVDIATPATFLRLANVYRGSFQGVAPTPEALRFRVKKTFPGLRRFCICGQWTTPGGGVGAAAMDGRLAARILRKELY